MTPNWYIHVFLCVRRPTNCLNKMTDVVTWSMVQKMCASSCWKRRTLVRPVSVPDSSFLWRTPKSASLRGSSLQERGLWLNIRLQDNQRAGIRRTVTHITYCVLSDLQHRGRDFKFLHAEPYQCPGQFMGLSAKMSSSTGKENMFSL